MALSRLRGWRPGHTDPVDRFVLLVPWLAVATAAILRSLGLAMPERYRWWPLVASVVVFGLPHGAVDHLAIPRVRGERPGIRWLGIVGAIYLVLGVAYGVVWFLAPAVAAAAFVAVTWLHWGQGDLHPLVSVLGAGHLDTALDRGLAVVVRGGLPMLVPLLSFPGRYRAVVERLVGLFDAPSAAVAWAFAPGVRAALGIGFGAVVAASVLRGFIRSRGRRVAWWADVAEVGLLWWFFWLVPPLVAVGVYFCLWHSVRHVGRLMAIDGGGGDLPGSLRRFARDAAPLSIAALAVGGGLALLVPGTTATVPDLVVLYLVLIALLTPPHVVVVSWMDREQGIW